jgi:predicted transcriptional regulator
LIPVARTNKNEKSSDSFSLISGTQGIAGTADTTMVLTRRRNTNAAKLEFTGRDIEEGVLNLAVDETTRMADLADPPQNMRENADRLLAVMPEDGAEINNAQLAQLAGTDRSNMTRDIAPLLQDGSVERVRRGEYRRRINAVDSLQLELPFEDAT